MMTKEVVRAHVRIHNPYLHQWLEHSRKHAMMGYYISKMFSFTAKRKRLWVRGFWFLS